MRTQSRARLSRKIVGLLVVGLLCLVSACSSGKGGSTSSSSSAQKGSPSASASGIASIQAEITKFMQPVQSYPAIAPVAGVSALKGKTVWWVPYGSAVPSLQVIGAAVQAALTAAGIKMETCDGKLLPTSIAACFLEASTQGADAVIAAYIDYSLVPAAYDALVAKHIPVLVAGEEPSGGKSSSAQLGFQNTTATGNMAARLEIGSVVVDSASTAKILYVSLTDSQTALTYTATAKAYTAQICSTCTFDVVGYSNATVSKLASQVSAALISAPATTYVVCLTDTCAQPALTGIQTAGFSGKVKLTSTGGALDALQRVSAGGPQFSEVGIGLVYLGWQYANGIIRQLTGLPPVSDTGLLRVFDKSNVAGLTLTPAAAATNDWYGTNSFQQTFLNAWKVS